MEIIILLFCVLNFLILCFLTFLLMRVSGFVVLFARNVEKRFKKIYQLIIEASDVEEEEEGEESGLVDLPNVGNYDPRYKKS